MANNSNSDGDNIITAKLVRGKNYSFNHHGVYVNFKRNVPVEVSEELAGILDEMIEEISTSDGDKIDKNVFEINWNATRRQAEDAAPKRVRLRIVPVEDKEPPRRPLVRKPPPGASRRAG